MDTWRVSALLLGSALLIASPASAGDAIRVELVPKALKGEGLPALVVHAEEPLERLVLEVRRSTDRRKVTLDAGSVGGGRSHRFDLPMKRVGEARFTGELSIELGDGSGGSMPIDVTVSLVGPLQLSLTKADVDVAARKLSLRADRDVKRVQVSVMSDLGTPLGTTEKDWDGDVIPAKDPVEVRWKQGKGTVMRITVKAWDADDFFGVVELFPWSVDIPHEEVNFATGSYEIPEAENDKLESCLEDIRGAIDKYGSFATIRLFIGGHTDTVGDSGSNRTLSHNRARAIGKWFDKRGVSIPILYAGFGEDALRVETPDSTDEPRNRRAEYIVAVDPPSIAGIRWKPL